MELTEEEKRMVEKCMTCRFFGTWRPDWFSDDRIVCKNPKVLEAYKEIAKGQFSLMVMEHEASVKWLAKPRGIDLNTALPYICKLDYFQQKPPSMFTRIRGVLRL